MLSRAERLARGGIVGGFATATAAISHALAGGYSPGALSLGAAFIFSALLATLAIGRRPSLPRLVAVVAVGQLAFHLLFSLLGSGDGVPTGRMSMADMAPVSVHPVMDAAAHLADPRMWLAHAIAAVLTIAFLRHVERAVWSLVHEALRFVLRTVRLAPMPAIAVARIRCRPRPLTSSLLPTAISRRGPPFFVSF